MSNTNTNSMDFNSLWREVDSFSFTQTIPFTKWDFLGRNFLKNILQEEFQNVKIDDTTNILKLNNLKICARVGFYKLNKKFAFSNVSPTTECDFIAFIGIAPNSIFLKLVAPSQIKTFLEPILEPKKHFGYIESGDNSQILLTDKTKKNTYSVSFKTDDLTIISDIRGIINIFGNKINTLKYEIPQENTNVLNTKEHISNCKELIKYMPFAPQPIQPRPATPPKPKSTPIKTTKIEIQTQVVPEPIETEQQVNTEVETQINKPLEKELQVDVENKLEITKQVPKEKISKIKTIKLKSKLPTKVKPPKPEKQTTKLPKVKAADDNALIYVLKKNDELASMLKQADEKTHLQEYKNKEMTEAIILLQDQLEALRVHTMEITKNGSDYIKNLHTEVNHIKEGYRSFESAMNELYDQNEFLLKKLALSRDTWWTPNGVKIWSEQPAPDNSLALRLAELEETVYKANTIPETISNPSKEVETKKEVVISSPSKLWQKCKNVIKAKPAISTQIETKKIESSCATVNTPIPTQPIYAQPVVQQSTTPQPIVHPEPINTKPKQEHFLFKDLEPFKDNVNSITEVVIQQPIINPTIPRVEEPVIVKIKPQQVEPQQIIPKPEYIPKPSMFPELNKYEPTITTPPINVDTQPKEKGIMLDDFDDFDDFELTPFNSTSEIKTEITPTIDNLETNLPDISNTDWDNVIESAPTVVSTPTISTPATSTETWTDDTTSNDDDWLF